MVPCIKEPKSVLARFDRYEFDRAPVTLFAKIPLNFRDKGGRDWLTRNPVSPLRFIVGQNYLYHFHCLEESFPVMYHTANLPI